MTDDREGDSGASGNTDTEESGSDADTGPPWYRSTLGLGLVGANLLLLLLLVVLSGSIDADGPLGNVASAAGNTGLGVATSPLTVPVPWYVYTFGAVGALAYVFTLLVVDFERSASSLARLCLRIPAALPLCAGVYLLSRQILGGDPPTQLIAGLAFLAGLYVDLTYRRLDALARRLLPSGGDESEADDGENQASDAESGTDGAENEADDAGGEATAPGDESERGDGRGTGTGAG